MAKDKKYINLRIRKKPWYVWLLWIVWFLWLLFWLEIAVGSAKEMETQAFVISFVVFMLSLAGGISIWIWNYRKNNRANKNKKK